jgi:hypothetical protein
MAWHINRLQMKELTLVWKVAMNILNKQSQTTNKGWYSSFGPDEVLTTPHHKNSPCYKAYQKASDFN